MLNCTKTKIVATLGPACANPELFNQMAHTGVTIARLNFSHGSVETRLQYLQTVRQAQSQYPVAVMGDLCGPKIRLGKVADGGMQAATGDQITIQRDDVIGANGILSSNTPCLVDDVQIGQKVLIDDGMIRMLVVDKLPGRIICQVTHGGLIQSNKGLNLPNTRLSIPSITDKDWTDLDWAVNQDLDYIALSFVRSSDDINAVRQFLDRRRSNIDIIAKIEMPQAVDDLPAILDAADGVLVARGDMGVEMELTSVPLIQKQIVAAAHDAGKPAIVATQMLQSMLDNPSPTRAEVSDVANAILDRADAVMLSGETAVGKYPLESVQTLRDIAERTERYMVQHNIEVEPPKLLQLTHHRTAAIAHGARLIAKDINARLVVVWSQAGGSARYLSKNRLPMHVVALSTDPAAVRRMALYYGVMPMRMDIPRHFDDLPGMVDDLVKRFGWAQPGERILIAAGSPLGTAGATNSLSVHTVGEAAS
ncbi:MAG: pyruvate kinase [Phycisphaerae bacterium]